MNRVLEDMVADMDGVISEINSKENDQKERKKADLYREWSVVGWYGDKLVSQEGTGDTVEIDPIEYDEDTETFIIYK